MGKVPVWRTIGEALAFTFHRYPAILGVVWLPLLLMGLCAYFALGPLFEALGTIAMHAAQHPDEADFEQEMLRADRFVPAFDVAVYLIMAWISVGVTKEALGLRSGPWFVYLGVGKAELLLIGAYLALFALIIGVEIAIILVFLLVFGIGALVVGSGAIASVDWTLLKPWAAAAIVAFALAVLCAFVYFAVRLTALLVPITVAEQRFGLVRSWQLSKGHFWNLLAIFVVTWLMLVVLELVTFAVIGVPLFFAASLAHAHANGPDAVSLVFKSVEPYLPLGGVVLLAVSPVLYGLYIAPWAFAYRALVPETPLHAAAAPAA
ncbi:MAG: hypothetical protein ACLQUZ_03495 [Rhizomicrobium sp.]